MPIVTGDLVVRLTTTAGAAGDSTAQGDPNASLGKYASTTALVDNTLHNLFDVITGDENALSQADYRALALLNNHASLSLLAPVLWISAETAGGAVAALGWDTTAPSAKGAAGAQLLQIANETTAPAGVTFSSPTSKATGLAMGADLPAQNVKGFWLRRTAQNNGAASNDGVTFTIEGDTAA